MENNGILFEYECTPAWSRGIGSFGGRTLCVNKSGYVTYNEYVHGKPEPTLSRSFDGGTDLANIISSIIESHKEAIKDIPENLDNGSLDGCFDNFTFDEKQIKTLNISQVDVEECKKENPEYYQDYSDNIEHENIVINLYIEIVKAIKSHTPDIQNSDIWEYWDKA